VNVNNNPSARSAQKASRGILDYLVRHPDAKDTIDGILKWWLPENEWDEEEVQEALDNLTSKGWLTKRQTTASQTVYGMNKDQRKEIDDFLDHSA
jgi:hypothetical protein